ncbi:pirin family protein [Alicyclobacillus tolerans]|uniref:pirin family protein n=1 Tax=Alicyclobacillus tolerans TaxID=90970 RepID=UPI001F2BE722|nr:pirin family protein [Alicyclobacillus tolerans]MCF8563928.1 pirin family protein [Alicyclobacillus tolerans]
MIHRISSESRYTSDHGWLLTKHSFSFADYYDPKNMNFGALRVFNDDVVQPGTGFGLHPHQNFEIVSCVLEGTLEHQDSMGNRGLLRAGEVQATTAGTGILHSEYNPSDDEPVHFLQIWFSPIEKNLAPTWTQKAFSVDENPNQLVPVVSGRPMGEALTIHQDATVYLSRLEPGATVTYEQQADRRMYLFVIEGTVVLNNSVALEQGDSARITETEGLAIASEGLAKVMLMDLA